MSSAIRDAVFWIFVAICAVSQFYIIRAVIRADVYSPHPVPPDGNTNTGADADNDKLRGKTLPVPNRAVEILWAVLPVLLMLAAFMGAWRLMHPDTP